MPGGCCSHCLCNQSEEQSHNLMGLGCRGQIQDLDNPENWVRWVPRTREGPQDLSPHGDSQPAGTGYPWMLGWTLPTEASHQSWSLAKQTWVGCSWSVWVGEQLALGMCGLWDPSCDLRRAQGARMLPRDFTLRKGSCESWQKPSWSCINSLVVQAGQVKHVPYLGFVTTLTEVPGVGQSCPCTWHLLEQEGCAEMEPASVWAWPSCSHVGDSLRSPLGSRWTQPLFPLSHPIQRLGRAAMLGHGCSLEGGERDHRGEECGLGEGDKTGPRGRGWGWYAAVVSCITWQDLPHAKGRSSFLWLKRVLGDVFARPRNQSLLHWVFTWSVWYVLLPSDLQFLFNCLHELRLLLSWGNFT